MRGDDQQTGHLFSYLCPEQRVPADHLLQAIRTMTDEALPRCRRAAASKRVIVAAVDGERGAILRHRLKASCGYSLGRRKRSILALAAMPPP
jgi:hypothetical protein